MLKPRLNYLGSSNYNVEKFTKNILRFYSIGFLYLIFKFNLFKSQQILS